MLHLLVIHSQFLKPLNELVGFNARQNDATEVPSGALIQPEIGGSEVTLAKQKSISATGKWTSAVRPLVAWDLVNSQQPIVESGA